MKFVMIFLLFFVPSCLFSECTVEIDNHNNLTRVDLQEYGSIDYIYKGGCLREIQRISLEGELLYTHTYNYNEKNEIISENLIGGLGKIVCIKDLSTNHLTIKSPLHIEECYYNEKNQLVTHIEDDLLKYFQYASNNELICNNSLTQIPCKYDSRKRLIQQTFPLGNIDFIYDDGNNLVQASTDHMSITYAYEDSGERLSKTVVKDGNSSTEFYVNLGKNPIAIFREGKLIQLRIPGLSPNKDLIRPIAIETEDTIYAPIHNSIGQITHLIDIRTQEKHSYFLDPYGQNLLQQTDLPTPWLFAGKHYDAETNLIYYGNRYYSPAIQQWLTPDPVENPIRKHPYQYCLDNPLFYCDPDGNFELTLLQVFWGAGTIITCPVWGSYALGAFAGAAVGYYGGKAIKKYSQAKREKRHTPDQQAINDLVKERGRKGISNADADVLLDWAEKYDLPARDDREKDHWIGGKHIHVGGGKHIPIKE